MKRNCSLTLCVYISLVSNCILLYVGEATPAAYLMFMSCVRIPRAAAGPSTVRTKRVLPVAKRLYFRLQINGTLNFWQKYQIVIIREMKMPSRLKSYCTQAVFPPSHTLNSALHSLPTTFTVTPPPARFHWLPVLRGQVA